MKVAAIVVEPSTFGGERSSLEVFAALAVTDVFSYMVKHSDDLATALSRRRWDEAGGEGRG